MSPSNLFTITLFLLLSTVTLKAQTVGQGAFMMGGFLNFSSDKFEAEDKARTYFTVVPSIGFYVIDDLAAGLNLSYSSVSIEGNSNTTTSLAPFVRYYVFNPFFVEAQFGFSLDKDGGSYVAADIGYSWFVSRNVAVEPMIFYINTNSDIEGLARSSFGFSVGIQTFIGR